MYILVMGVAESRHGLPVCLFTLPVEFPNLLNTCIASVWAPWTATRGLHSRHVWTFVLLISVVMGLLVTVMGPATATLALPTLKWMETSSVLHRWSYSSDAAEAVNETSSFIVSDSGCSADDLTLGRYSCATEWSRTLDNWVISAIDTFTTYASWEAYTWRPNNESMTGITNSMQDGMTLYLNETWSYNEGDVIWVPRREMLDQLSMDQSLVLGISWGDDAALLEVPENLYQQYAMFNDTLGTRLRRRGAIIGVLPSVWRGQPWTTKLDEDRSIMCFPNYAVTLRHPYKNDIDNSLFTKCIQVGDGWAKAQHEPKHRSRRFSIDASNDTSPAVLVDVFSSSRAVFFHPDIPALNGSMLEDRRMDIPALRLNETIPVGLFCNWTHFFGSYNMLSDADELSFVNTLLFSRGGNDTTSSLAVSYVAKLGYTTYELDTWPGTNPLNLVQTPYLYGISSKPIPIDPSWTLAAWGVDLENGHVLHNSSTALLRHSIFDHPGFDDKDAWKPDYKDKKFGNTILALLTIPVVQTLSLAEWSASTKPHDEPSIATTLQARIYVWAYGIDSKMASLGVVVAMLGCLVACLQFAAGLHFRRRQRTLTQVLVAALAHQPQENGIAHSATRFHATDVEHEVGGLRFSRWSATVK